MTKFRELVSDLRVKIFCWIKNPLFLKDWQLQFEGEKQKATKFQDPMFGDCAIINLKGPQGSNKGREASFHVWHIQTLVLYGHRKERGDTHFKTTHSLLYVTFCMPVVALKILQQLRECGTWNKQCRNLKYQSFMRQQSMLSEASRLVYPISTYTPFHLACLTELD